MSPLASSKPSRKKDGAAGAKMLVTAASIAAVISGWAAFTVSQSQAVGDSEIVTVDDESMSAEVAVILPPLPTLVPEIGGIPTTGATFPTNVTPTPIAPPVGVSPGGKEPSTKTVKIANKPAKRNPVTKTHSSK